MNAIIITPEFKAALAEILAYQTIDGKNSLYIHKNNKTDIGISTRDNGRNQSARSYAEFVHATTLVSLFGMNYDTTDDGLVEADTVINWMSTQK